MTGATPSTGLRIHSTVRPDRTVEITLDEVAVAAPRADEVLVRIDAAPINPSDLLSLLPGVELSHARFEGTPERPRVLVPLASETARDQSARSGVPLTIGLEGAGVVVAAGNDARALLGKRVALLTLARGLFAQYVTVPASICVPLPEGVSTRDAAALFVNPMTALAIAETARIDGHVGLIQTAAASNLGQMLLKICLEDDLPIVNIVRRPQHLELLRKIGATHVCDSSAPSFSKDLVRAIEQTRATVAFDALGGGTMAHQLLAAMEQAAAARMKEYSPYGSAERKHVHVYGHLDTTPLQLQHESYGLLWGVSGWVMPSILERVGPQRAQALQARALTGIKSTFASTFTREISLAQALQRDVMLAYCQQATGQKYLINPSLR